MNASIAFEKCLTFLNMEIQPNQPLRSRVTKVEAWRAVTVSRQTGSGGHTFAEELAAALQKVCPGNGRPWTVFDRNLVEKVLEDHHLPTRLARFMPEDRVSEMRDAIDELCGLHPSSWTLARQTAETILRLADLGNVVIIGRGSHVITRHLPYVFHVRLVAPLEQRVLNCQKQNNLSPKAALQFVKAEDRGRARYLKKHFDADINNPELYHLIINTERVTIAEAARMVAQIIYDRAEVAGPGL